MDGKRKDVTREYVKMLSSRHDALSSLRNRCDMFTLPLRRNRCDIYTLPLHVIFLLADDDDLEWTSVDLLLSKLPPHMAKQALMWKDGDFQRNPLHIAAKKAPQSTFVRMLALVPEAVSIQDCRGFLPLSFAISSKHTTAVELLTKAYPKGIIVKDNKMNDAIWKIFHEEVKISNFEMWYQTINSLIKGLLTGLSNNSSDSDMLIFTSAIFDLIFVLYPFEAMIAFREIVNEFIEQYENGDKCNLCLMILRRYCIIFPSFDVFYLEPSLKIMFGEYLGVRTFSMVVEYKLLNIIEDL